MEPLLSFSISLPLSLQDAETGILMNYDISKQLHLLYMAPHPSQFYQDILKLFRITL